MSKMNTHHAPLPSSVEGATVPLGWTVESRRYPRFGSKTTTSGMTIRYSLGPLPAHWGVPLLVHEREPDDDLHNPDPRRDRLDDEIGGVCTSRGCANIGSLVILATGLLAFLVGFPVITSLRRQAASTQGGFNIGGINMTGQIPLMSGNFGLVDNETPMSVRTKPSYVDPSKNMILVFSDEFNTEGRTFYPGDDPYWEAVDLHYWGTKNLEWYDPVAATTKDGALQLTFSRVSDPSSNHNMEYRSAMIQTWNKFCFTGGILEASVRLPGSNTVSGLWPAVWAMGNLGRAGYGATLDGMWPYTYDACDVGTLPNQTYPGTSLPAAVFESGASTDGALSYLPGQRLSACTCPGEAHPGPIKPDRTFVGRAAPEIDVFEAVIEDGMGKVSLSAQWGPYNAQYSWPAHPEDVEVRDLNSTEINIYRGGVYQQTTSALAQTNQGCYELTQGCFAVYAFEYRPGFDNAYIAWVNDARLSWILHSAAMGPDDRTEISARPMPLEPMYIIANLGMSRSFGEIEFEALQLPTTMSIDWIRVYQPEDAVNVGCDPEDFPTMEYIKSYPHLYNNANITTWEQSGEPWPKNRLQESCD